MFYYLSKATKLQIDDVTVRTSLTCEDAKQAYITKITAKEKKNDCISWLEIDTLFAVHLVLIKQYCGLLYNNCRKQDLFYLENIHMEPTKLLLHIRNIILRCVSHEFVL